MRMSVVILTWNDKNILKTCLMSLLRCVDLIKDEIIVIDNGSIDNTEHMIRTKFPNVRYYYLDSNYGISKARNIGIGASKGHYIMSLDSDTVLPIFLKDIGSVVEEIFKEHSNIGLFSFRLINHDGTLQNNVRRFPCILQPFISRVRFLRRFKTISYMHIYHQYKDINLTKNRIYDIDYALGANHIFRKQTAYKVGYYDESIFFGPEDLEFCLRIRRSGMRVCLVNDIHIIHLHRRRTIKFNWIAIKHLNSYLKLFLKEKTITSICV